MKIYVHNAEEYVAVRLAICGELDQENVLASAPRSKVSMYRAIKNLKDSRVLIRHRYSDGRTFLRLSSLCTDYLRSLSPALLANARTVVNENIKYNGTREARMRDRVNYEFYRECLDQNIEINRISCEYSPEELFSPAEGRMRSEGTSVFSTEDGIDNLESIVKDLPRGYTGLLTKRAVKKKEKSDITSEGNRISRISGTLILRNQVYQTYVLTDPINSTWKTDAEFAGSNYIIGAIERHNPNFSKKGIRLKNQCIFLLSTSEQAGKLIFPGDEKPRMDPRLIYDECYVLPSYKIGDAKLRLFALPDWKKAITIALFPGSTEGIADAIADDGTEIYNLIGCDLKRISEITPRVLESDEKSVLMVESWMAEPMHEIFSRDNIEIVEINDDQLRTLADNIA